MFRDLNTIFDYLFHLITAIILVIMTLPICLWIAFKVWSESGCPIFFIQTRVGVNGKHFRIYKFRTMTNNATKHAPFICTSYEDSRITEFGKFLRKKKLDELPQLINIIKGEMRFVGPRPEVPYFHELNLANIKDWGERIKVKPGITGYAQIHPRISHDPNEKIIEDLRYLREKSLLLDCKLMFATINAWLKDRIL